MFSSINVWNFRFTKRSGLSSFHSKKRTFKNNFVWRPGDVVESSKKCFYLLLEHNYDENEQRRSAQLLLSTEIGHFLCRRGEKTRKSIEKRWSRRPKKFFLIEKIMTKYQKWISVILFPKVGFPWNLGWHFGQNTSYMSQKLQNHDFYQNHDFSDFWRSELRFFVIFEVRGPTLRILLIFVRKLSLREWKRSPKMRSFCIRKLIFWVLFFWCFFECSVFLLFWDFGCPEAPFWEVFWLIFRRSGPLRNVMRNLYEKHSKNVMAIRFFDVSAKDLTCSKHCK